MSTWRLPSALPVMLFVMQMKNKPLCPYCSFDFGDIPKRKRKCPSCGGVVYLKSTPANRDKRLMTASEAESAEDLWQKYHTRQASTSTLSAFDIDVSELEYELKIGAPSERDALKIILNRIANSKTKLHTRKMAFGHLAAMAEQDGEPFSEFLKMSTRCELLNYKASGVKRVEIFTAGENNSCQVCQGNAGTIFPIEEALRAMPIPCNRCIKTISGKNIGFKQTRGVRAPHLTIFPSSIRYPSKLGMLVETDNGATAED